MTWSLKSVSYRMSGSGSWQLLLPDRTARRLYADLYPEGAVTAGEARPPLLLSWQKAGIIAIHGERIVSLGPIMTDGDLEILAPWFERISSFMCETVLERLEEYRALAKRLAGGDEESKEVADNILTIAVCAHTLDSWVFALLRERVMGTYPPRDFAGTFFFWGYAFSGGPKRIYGFTTYGGRGGGRRIHVLRSHGLDRERLKSVLRRRETLLFAQRFLTQGHPETLLHGYAGAPDEAALLAELRNAGILSNDDPPRFAIPVFPQGMVGSGNPLYAEAARRIADQFVRSMDGLIDRIGGCSFSRCFRPDTLCMLFHLAYSYAADKLVGMGAIPDFPSRAAGEWGVWVH